MQPTARRPFEAGDEVSLLSFAPDTKVLEHTVRFGSGPWTTVMGVLAGTFSRPMKNKDGSVVAPTGKAFRVPMVTVAHWNAAGQMDHEWVFSDDQVFLQQIGIAR